MLLLPLLAAALLAGCGSSGSKSNGESSKTADQIVADAKAAVADATSVHIAGAGSANGTTLALDLHLVADKGGEGRVTANGITFDMVRIEDTAYFKADASFWKNFGPSAAALLLQGRWLKAPANTGQLATFTPLTDIDKLFNALLGSHGTLAKGDETTINGQPAIAVNDTTQGGTLYVATTGKPYPLAVQKSGKGRIDFTEWDEPHTITAPSGAVDLTKLTGG